MIDLIVNYTNLHYNSNETRIIECERPELFIVCSKIFDLVNETLLGPNILNQIVLYKHSNIQKWILILKRRISDIDSFFYELQEKFIDYVIALSKVGTNEHSNHPHDIKCKDHGHDRVVNYIA